MKMYELASFGVLTPRTPKILRVDGKAFHTFTRGFEKPWDRDIMSAMDFAAHGLMGEIQGAKLAYIQSDEISILITDYSTLDEQTWFGGKVQKMVSVGSSIATAYFNEKIRFCGKSQKPALFDARVFCVPESDVDNYFLWRQRDAERNSIQGICQAHFSHKELQGKNTKELVSFLETEKGIIWGDLKTSVKRGWCVKKTDGALRSDWNIPRFGENREYITGLLPKPI